MNATAPATATRAELATLWVDEPGVAFNVALVCRFGSGAFLRPDGSPDLDRLRHELSARAAGVPTLRRRLTEGPRPVWTEDAFRPEAHVTCTALPTGRELLDWCADRIVAPLDRGRPLWRADLIGPFGGGFALLFVAHHVLADGRRGVAILRALLDDPPEDFAAAGPDPVATASPPGPRHGWQQARDAVRELRRRAPVTSLSRPLGPGRRIAVAQADLDLVHRTGAVVGATVNDVLLAAVTAGLRALLTARGDAVTGLALRASVPVSSDSARQPEGLLLISLPVGEPDPLRRLTTIAATTTALKSRLRAGGGTVFDVLRLPTPVAHAAVRVMRRIAARGINVFVTDVPGPAQQLSLAGAPLLEAVPVAPLTADVPLGIAALSYAGRLSVAANADAGITDLDVLRDAVEEEFAILASTILAPAPTVRTSDRHDQRREEPA